MLVLITDIECIKEIRYFPPPTSPGIWFVFATLLDVDVKGKWFSRPASRGKTALMVLWMFMSTILVLAYKNVLLSKLITSTFEEPIDSVDDMLEQKVVLMLPTGTSGHDLFMSDPRENFQQLAKTAKFYQYRGNIPKPILTE